MAKGLNKEMQVTMRFKANTSELKQELASVQQQLNHLLTSTSGPRQGALTQEIQQASIAAATLKSNLTDAINVDTGNLDLGKFVTSMNKSGMSLEKYRMQLAALGPEGTQAFSSLANAIATAEVPLRRQSQLLQELMVTFGNTVRWQATSTAIHAIMGAVQGAYGYAKDLNKELNNIRIVTQKSAEHMKNFAVEANNAAKGLSTTTKDYLEASLIYFQQGLDEADVKERTETTIKLANVSRESAEEVSQQMTAIWNNFAKGGENLEYYADVLTALGATTASSTAEISTGLEKFAGVAQTVGLSYEYAAAALATVTATTRQSADVVGTAFKTLFARLESLKLGETLEDDTDLNKYSQALADVGVQIKDTNGDLKSMDQILDETAARWDELRQDQQVALAQTVAGVRQYTSFITLMSHWDFMEENLETARNATGTLQQQADIYAESWEAAAKRVQASAQALYASLLDDKFFIQLTNGFASIIDGVQRLVKSIGGLRGVLLGVATILQKQIGNGLGNMIYNLRMQFGGAEAMKNIKSDAQKQSLALLDTSSNKGSAQADILKEQTRLRLEFIDKGKDLGENEQLIFKTLMQQNDAYGKQVVLAQQVIDKTKLQVQLAQKTFKGDETTRHKIDQYGKDVFTVGIGNSLRHTGKNLNIQELLNSQDIEQQKQGIESLKQAFNDLKFGMNEVGTSFEDLNIKGETAFNRLAAALKSGDPKEIQIAYQHFLNVLAQTEIKVEETEEEFDKAERETKEYAQAVGDASGSLAQGAIANMQFRESTEAVEETLRRTIPEVVTLEQALGMAVGAITSSLMAINQFITVWETFNDESATTRDKIMALSMAIGMLIPAITSIKALQTKWNIEMGVGAATMGTLVGPILAVAAAIGLLVVAYDQFSPEGKLKKAKKASEELSEAANTAKENLASIPAAMDHYDELVQKLADAKENTAEWAQAARDVNDAMTELQNNPAFMKYAELEWKDDHFEVTNKDKVEENLAADDAKARAINLMGQVDTAHAQTNVSNNVTSYSKDFQDLRWSTGHYYVDKLIGKAETFSSKEDIDAEIEEMFSSLGENKEYDSTYQAVKEFFSQDANVNRLLTIGQDKTGNKNSELNAIKQLTGEIAIQRGLTGTENFDKLYELINDNYFDLAKQNKNPEDLYEALIKLTEKISPSGGDEEQASVKDSIIATRIANFDKQIAATEEQLAKIDELRSLLSKDDATAEDYSTLGIDWDALGISLTDFITATDEEQKQLLANYQQNLQDTALASEEARNRLFEGQEQLDANAELEIKRALYQKQSMEDLAEAHGLDAEEVKDLAKHYEKYGGEIKGLSKDLKDNEKNAAKIALANSRMNKGLTDLKDNWEDYHEILKDNNKTSDEYQRTIKNLRNNVNDILGLDFDSLSDDFFKDATNLALIENAANGDIKAIEALRNAAAADIVLAGIDDEQARLDLQHLLDDLQTLEDANQFEIGATIDDGPFLQKCQEIVNQANMTADQAAEYFKALGYDVELQKVEDTSTSTIRTTGSIMAYTDKGTGAGKNIPFEKPINTTAITTTTTQVPVIKSLTYKGSAGGTVNFTNKRGGGSKGGGSSKTAKTKDDEIERYHVVREQIRDLTAEYDKVNKTKDRLFGNNRIKAIESEIAITDKLIGKQKEYINEIKDYLGKDSDKLAAGIFDYTGITANIVDGVLINYEEVMGAAVDKLKGDKSEKAEENYEKFKKLISTYEETFKLLDDAEAELTDLVNRNQDATFEKLNYKVELRLDINKRDLRELENDIMLLGDSVYKATERLDILWSEEEGLRDKFDNVNDAVNVQADKLEQLNYTFEHGLISEAQYTEGLQAVGDALQDNLKTLIDYDDEMRTYYSTTLSNANDEIAFWTKQLEHSTTVLEHYQKILELSGHSGDYAMMGVLLKGQVLTRQNSYQASAQWLNVLKDQRAQVEDEMRRAQHRADGYREGSPEYQAAMQEVEWLRDKYNSIIEETNNAEEQMLSDFESYLEAMNADLENDITKINKQYEMLATNGLGFDYIKSDLEELSTIQEEYLTKTNQVYETTKFLRQIQNDMDKTDSVAQKSRLQNHIKIVEGLKEQGQLSKVQLEIEKRRYEVELAQMALEDAKNAKSVVRLSRDSEGNYGYVYSADPNKQNDAEQALADKQNDLYNYALETYNTNIGKLNDLYQEQQEKLTALEQEYSEKNLLNSEEYNNKRNEIIKRYEDEAFIYIQNITDARNALNETALTDYTEAYASHYANIITTIDQWRQLTNENVTAVHDRYKEWSDTVGNEVRDVVGESLTDIKDKTKDVTSASNELAQMIQTQVLPKLQSEVQRVNDVTEAYEQQRRSILSLIDAMRQMMSYTNSQLNTMSTSASFDKNTDYYDLQREAAKRGLITSTSDSLYQSSTNAREAKVSWLQTGGADVQAYLKSVDYKGTIDKFYNHSGAEATEIFARDLANGVFNSVVTKYKDLDNDELLRRLKGLSTGGYTGSWGNDDGRLALLHEKELVLNEADTQNILNAVDFVRELASSIDLHALSAAAGLGYLSVPGLGGAGQGTFDQNVHIEASFPSVTDHNEIEEALNNLVNRAAQYAGRR